jgi:enoyl-CoA hydratase/carnithine racemase
VPDMTSWQTVGYHVEGGTAVVTLNRPERMNAWNAQLARELSEALDEADGDDAVRAVVLTGAGRAFCAGADLESGGDTFDADRNERRRRGEDEPMRLPYQLHKPVIAAINGAAVGVGITYPLLADVRIVAADAKISFAFVRRGMLPELASHAILPRVVGLSNAADLLLSGRMITGAEAADLGLASAAVPAADVLPAALAWAREVALAAPASVALAKRLLWEPLMADIATTTERERPLFAWAGRQADAREGITSFLERRPPQWTLSPLRDLPEWPET